MDSGDPQGELLRRMAMPFQPLLTRIDDFEQVWGEVTRIEERVRSTYTSLPTIVEDAREALLYLDDAEVVQTVCDTADIVRQHLADQSLLWTEPTVNDRITVAFKVLRAEGILALECAGWNTQDGWVEVVENRHLLPDAWGATFFHEQDVERGVQGMGLMLAFGPLDDQGEEDALPIAQRIIEVLTAHDVSTTWNGSVHSRIQIDPFPWKRRP